MAATVLAVVATGCDFDGAYDLPLPGSPVGDDNSYVVTAEFGDILNVVPRSPIRVDDVVIGEVTEVDRVGWHARVTMRVRDDVELPDNATAVIEQTSLLGEKYIALRAPTEGRPLTGRLEEGDNIPLSRTSQNPEVEEVLDALSLLLSGGGVGQLATITDELNDVFDGRTAQLRSLLGNLRSFIGTLDRQKGDIISALESINSLTRTLNEERTTIQDALDVTGPAVEVLDDQHEQLIAMLSSLERLGDVGTRVIRGSRDDLLKTLDELQPVLANLNKTGTELGPGLAFLAAYPFPPNAATVAKGDYANVRFQIAADLNALFEVSGADPTPLLDDLFGITDDVVDGVGQTVSGVLRCLRSGSITSQACAGVLRDMDLLPKLVEACQQPSRQRSPVCRALGGLTGGGDGDGGLVPDLPSLPGLLGLSRMTTALSGDAADETTDTDELLGGLR